jgi:hypothetical protein
MTDKPTPPSPPGQPTNREPADRSTVARRLRRDAPGWRQAIETGIADHHRGRHRGMRRHWWASPAGQLATAAGIALAIGLGFWLNQPHRAPEPGPVVNKPAEPDAADSPRPTLDSIDQTPPPDQPMLNEADRLVSDAQRAASFVFTQVPGRSADAGSNSPSSATATRPSGR